MFFVFVFQKILTSLRAASAIAPRIPQLLELHPWSSCVPHLLGRDGVARQ